MAEKCVHFGRECNGCKLMGLDYPSQLSEKSGIISELFGKRITARPAPSELGYRNRVDLSYIDGRLGYRDRNNFYTAFELKNCLLVSDRVNLIIQATGSLLKDAKIKEAQIMQRKDGLRYVVARRNRKDEIMINFVFFGQIDEKIEPICEKLISDGVASVNILMNNTWGDTAYGDVVKNFGSAGIEETVLGKKFVIGPNTFFQTNVASAERIFSRLKEHVPQGSRLLDLYCGVGTISCVVADKCEYVVGIESVFESVSNARKNAIENKAENARFIYWNVDKMVKHMKGFDVFVLDPPRSGANPKALKRIGELAPQKIIYVSCNPKTLARDLLEFSQYEIKELEAFDQFPQTGHLEMLAVLERKTQGE